MFKVKEQGPSRTLILRWHCPKQWRPSRLRWHCCQGRSVSCLPGWITPPGVQAGGTKRPRPADTKAGAPQSRYGEMMYGGNDGSVVFLIHFLVWVCPLKGLPVVAPACGPS